MLRKCVGCDEDLPSIGCDCCGRSALPDVVPFSSLVAMGGSWVVLSGESLIVAHGARPIDDDL